MDAIDFYHTDECSSDIYEAMEQYTKHSEHKLLDTLHECKNALSSDGSDKCVSAFLAAEKAIENIMN